MSEKTNQELSVLPETVRLQYVGANVGAITFMVNGHTYRGGQNPQSRFIDVPAADVEQLILTGRWAQVVRSVPSVPSEPVPVAKETQPKVVQEVLTESAPKAMADVLDFSEAEEVKPEPPKPVKQAPKASKTRTAPRKSTKGTK